MLGQDSIAKAFALALALCHYLRTMKCARESTEPLLYLNLL